MAAVACGAIFELPLVVRILHRLGLVSIAFLTNNRRYAILLSKGLDMFEHTLSMAERTGEESVWVERARVSKRELERAVEEEQRAIDALPFSREEMQRAAAEKLALRGSVLGVDDMTMRVFEWLAISSEAPGLHVVPGLVLKAHGAELVDEVVNYEDVYRLCYIRGPEGLLVGLAEELKR